MISTLAVIGAIVGAISGLASLALLLLFLWPVYDRGGRTDLVAAGKALRQVYDRPWSAKEPLRTELVDRLRTPTSEVTDVKADLVEDHWPQPAPSFVAAVDDRGHAGGTRGHKTPLNGGKYREVNGRLRTLQP